MSFLITAVPIIFIIIISILGVVLTSNSKSYLKNADNNKQLELERARNEALKMIEEMKKIRSQESSNSQENTTNQNANEEMTTSSKPVKIKRNVVKRSSKVKNIVLEDNKTSDNFQEKPVINRYEKYLKERKIEQQPQNLAYALEDEKKVNTSAKTLVFSKENLVRGLITKEYLHKRNGSRGV